MFIFCSWWRGPGSIFLDGLVQPPTVANHWRSPLGFHQLHSLRRAKTAPFGPCWTTPACVFTMPFWMFCCFLVEKNESKYASVSALHNFVEWKWEEWKCLQVKLQKHTFHINKYLFPFDSVDQWISWLSHGMSDHGLLMIMTVTSFCRSSWFRGNFRHGFLQIHLQDIKSPFSEESTEDSSDHCTTSKAFTCKEGIWSGTCVCLLWRFTRWEDAALVNVRYVSGFACPKKAKDKQSAQLQPWEFFFSNRWTSKTFTENLSNAIRLVKLRAHWRSTWAWWLKFGPGPNGSQRVSIHHPVWV